MNDMFGRNRKVVTCYEDEEGNYICGDKYIGIRPIYEETIGWYSNNNNIYCSECKSFYISKEELAEYLKKFDK